MVTHDWLATGGRSLHRMSFDGTGRPLVCVHGVTGCAWIWHHLALQLHDVGKMIAVDLRGHGWSDWTEHTSYRTTDHADDLEAVIGDLGPGSVDLIGSSWGALVALATAARRPESVRRLVLVDIEPSSELSEEAVPERPRHFPAVADGEALWRALNPHAPDDLVTLLAVTSTRPASPAGRVPLHDPVFFERWPFRSEDWWPALGEVPAPTLIVHAEDTWVRGEVCDRMAASMPRAERLDIAGSTHVIPVDRPVELGRAVAQFLRA